MNINFLIISWRGFSGNKGKPTEQGLYKDARSALNWLKNKGIKEILFTQQSYLLL